MTQGNRGTFYIKAEDVNSIDSFKVPGDRTGYTPNNASTDISINTEQEW